MQLFVNEYSLQEQFSDHSQFANAVVMFTLLIRRIRRKGLEGSLYKNSLLVNYSAVHGVHFLSSLNRIPQRDIRENFIRIVFDRFNHIDWQTERKHRVEDLFTFDGDIVTETSMAELAERKFLEDTVEGCLLNFIESSLPNGDAVKIVKNENQAALIDSFDQQEAP